MKLRNFIVESPEAIEARKSTILSLLDKVSILLKGITVDFRNEIRLEDIREIKNAAIYVSSLKRTVERLKSLE
jgi:hypothetical protein